jgi:hypothetical protein
MALITVQEVRNISGVTVDLVDDDSINQSIAEAEREVSRYLNAAFTPVETIDVLDGNGTNIIVLPKSPVLALRELKINGTSITLAGNLFFSRDSGKLEINAYGTAEEKTFRAKSQSIIVKYVHGWLEPSNRQTTTTAASTTGNSVALAVSDEEGFEVNSWIEIYGMDGYKECAKVTAVTTNQITVDILRFSHESGSVVKLLEVREEIKKLMRCVASISAVARVLGQSFDDITGYTMGEFSVQKGEPYTQWRETAVQLQGQAREILARVKPRPAIF